MKLSRIISSLLMAALISASLVNNALAQTRAVQAKDIFYSSLPDGSSVACLIRKGKNAVPGKVAERKQQLIFSSLVKQYQSKIAGVQNQLADKPGSKNLIKRLNDLKSKLKEAKAACTGNADDGGSGDPLEARSNTLSAEDTRYFLEKVGFGTGPREALLINIANTEGLNGLVNKIFSRRGESAGVLETMEDWTDGELENDDERNLSTGGIRNGWMHLLVNTNNPFREKLGIFLWTIWGGSGDVLGWNQGNFLWDYIKQVREFAYAPDLRNLTRDLTTSAFMLRYGQLDASSKDGINSRYAQRLLEYYILGNEAVAGNPSFTEADIQAAAKALTGWHLEELEDSEGNMILTPFYISTDHVQGNKQIFTHLPSACTIDTEEDLYNCLFDRHPNAARFYARKLLQFYVNPTPPENLVNALAFEIKKSNFNLDAPLRKLFLSKSFFATANRNSVPKLPIEIAVEWVRMLNMPVNIADGWRGLRAQIDRMDFYLTDPPDAAWYSRKNFIAPELFADVSNFYAASIISAWDLEDEQPWQYQELLPKGEVFSREIILHVANKMGVSMNETRIAQLKYYMDQVYQWDWSIDRQLYDNTLEDHQQRKGVGLYFTLALTTEFQFK